LVDPSAGAGTGDFIPIEDGDGEGNFHPLLLPGFESGRQRLHQCWATGPGDLGAELPEERGGGKGFSPLAFGRATALGRPVVRSASATEGKLHVLSIKAYC
jgi:hypothetical protein